MADALERLKSRLTDVASLDAVSGLLVWDQRTTMPPAGGSHRADHLSLMQRMSHELLIDPETGRLLDELESVEASLDPDSIDASTVRVARRDYEKAVRVPAALRAEMARSSAESVPVWLEAKTTSNFELFPVPKTVVHTVTGDIAGSDGTCTDGTSDRPCRIVVFPIHNAGPIEAVLSWTPAKAADLDVTLFQTGVATPLARSASTGPGPERVTATLTVGATYEFHITYAAGSGRVTYSLRVTHMN